MARGFYSKGWFPDISVNFPLKIMSDSGELWSGLRSFTAMLHYICACGSGALTFYKLHPFNAPLYIGTRYCFYT